MVKMEPWSEYTEYHFVFDDWAQTLMCRIAVGF